MCVCVCPHTLVQVTPELVLKLPQVKRQRVVSNAEARSNQHVEFSLGSVCQVRIKGGAKGLWILEREDLLSEGEVGKAEQEEDGEKEGGCGGHVCACCQVALG